MFGSDKCNVVRRQGGQSETSVSSTRLVRGVSPGGCGVQIKDKVPDPNQILSGGDDRLVGGISQPGAADYELPVMEVSDVVWRDENLILVQDEDDALNIVDNA